MRESFLKKTELGETLMSTQIDLKQKVMDFLAAFDSRDIEACMRFFSEDACLRFGVIDYQGLDAIRIYS